MENYVLLVIMLGRNKSIMTDLTFLGSLYIAYFDEHS